MSGPNDPFTDDWIGVDVVTQFGADPLTRRDSTDQFRRAHDHFLHLPASFQKQIIVPDGTYLLNGGRDGPQSGGGISWAVASYVDNLRWVAGPGVTYKTTVNCATFLVAGASKPAGPTNWASFYMSDVTQTPVDQIVGPIADGAMQIPLAVIANAAKYAPDDYVFLRTGQTAGLAGSQFRNNPDSEINQIKAVDLVTGILTLRMPLMKPMVQEYWTTVTQDGATTTTVTAWPAPFGIAKVTDRTLVGAQFQGGKFKHTGNLTTPNANGAPIYRGGIQGFGLWDFVLNLDEGSESSTVVDALNENRGTRRSLKRVHFTAEANQVYHDILNADTGCTDYKAEEATATSDKGVVTMEIHEGAAGVDVAPHILVCPPGDTSTVPVLSFGGRNYKCTVHEPTLINGPVNSQTILASDAGVGNGNRLIRPALLGVHPHPGNVIFVDGSWDVIGHYVAPGSLTGAGGALSIGSVTFPNTIEYESGYASYKRLLERRRTLTALAAGNTSYLDLDQLDGSAIFYLDPADFGGGARNLKLRIKAMFAVNALSPGATTQFSVTLWKVQSVGGGAGVVVPTAVVLPVIASTAATSSGGLAANSFPNVVASADFTFPVAGAYVMTGNCLTANMAANSAVAVSAALELRQDYP